MNYIKTEKKSKWVHEINAEREQFREFVILILQLQCNERKFYLYIFSNEY